ncbi:unnamed protein product [Paramecium octaurelia]|uniref:Protein kinase domain protein n=1 Tax=Paramecium octaurelia TaxID=43137 RepID=A0A8S1UYE4_PAROT|nr:unnamed protein product [Paramecium octaurelia]
MFYAAQIILALEYLHSKGIIFRDLKPENIVICQDGYVKLTDFGLCKKGDFTNISGASSICGTPAYMAPEILQKKQYGKAVDWWAFGCFLYEMVAGHPPFFASNKQDLEYCIVNSQPNMGQFSIKLQDLIYRLLEKNPKNRLTTNIRDHQWFNIDFDAILNKKETAPFLPTLQNEADVTYFDPQFIKSSMSEQCSIIDELDSYKDFTYKGSQEQSVQQSFQTLSPEIIGLNENGEAKQMIKVESTEMINQ